MIRAIALTRGELKSEIPLEQISTYLKDENALLWVDFQASNPEEDYPLLLDTFGFHPLAVDDALRETHVPKVDDWGDYLYLVLHVVSYKAGSGQGLVNLELDVFLGHNLLVTHHDEVVSAVDRLWEACHRDIRHMQYGADHLLYRLADEVVASFMPVVDQLDDEIDNLEDQTFVRPTSDLLERIFQVKRAAIHLRRILGPQREVLNKLARDDFSVIDFQVRVYFRDVYDHLVRLYDISDGLRDLVAGTLDLYLSVVNNRMNDIMKTLTMITTLFMPLSFLAGFFGMNFFVPRQPVSSWVSAGVFPFVLFFMIASPLLLYVWMKNQGWM